MFQVSPCFIYIFYLNKGKVRGLPTNQPRNTVFFTDISFSPYKCKIIPFRKHTYLSRLVGNSGRV